MAPLTWRNVDAPSFAASNALLASANDMFNKGFGALDDTLGRFQGAQINNDSNRTILEAMRYGDPESYKNALMNGTIAGGVDPRNLNAAALDFMAGRERSLVGTDQAKSTLLGTDVANRTNIIGLDARGIDHENFLRKNSEDAAAREFIASNLNNFGKDSASAIRYAQTNIKNPEVLKRVVSSIQTNGDSFFVPGYSDYESWEIENGLNSGGGSAPPADKVALGGDVSNIPGATDNTAALIGNEGGKAGFSAANSEGYVGRGQFGDDRLADAKVAGVIPGDMTKEQFRKSPEAQKAVEAWHFADIDNFAAQNGIDKLYGQNIGGVVINRDSVRAMAHLGGSEGMKLFIQTGGAYNPADSNGTKLSDYGKTYGGGSAEGGQRTPGSSREYSNFAGDPNNIDLMSYVNSPTIPQEAPAQTSLAQPGDGRPYNPDLGQFAAPTDTPQVENTDTKDVPTSTTEAPRTQFDQALDKMLTESEIAGGVEKVRTGLASGAYGASGSPLGDFAGDIGDFFTTDQAEGARRNAERETTAKALEWWNKKETRQYFIDNPGELEKAQQDPIRYAQAQAAKPAATPTPAPAATAPVAAAPAPVDPVAQIAAASGEAFDMGSDDAKFNAALADAVGFTQNANIAVNTGEFLDGYMTTMPDRGKSPGVLATELAERTGMQRNYVVNQLSKLKGLGVPEHIGAQILENNQFSEGEGLLGFLASDKDKVVRANGAGVAADVARFRSIDESVGRQTVYQSTEEVDAALQVATGRQEQAVNDRNTKLAMIDAGRLPGVTKEQVIAEFRERMSVITKEISQLNKLASQYSNANLNLEEMAK